METVTPTNRLRTHTAASLASLPVAGADGLRAPLKAGYAACNRSPDFLRTWGAARFGIWGAGCDKATAIAMLLGKPGSIIPGSQSHALPVSPAPSVETMPAPQAANPAAMAAMNQL